MSKTVLRQTLLRCRSAMDPTEWRRTSCLAQKRLILSEMFASAESVALYWPIRNEVDTVMIFEEARLAGKRTLFPRICGKKILFYEVKSSACLERGSFGILEPCMSGAGYAADKADLVVVPGVAFDLQGHRLGFGKGFYDRCLSGLSEKIVLAGLCHDFQLLEHLPNEEHDIRMQYIITDKRLFEVGTDPMAVG